MKNRLNLVGNIFSDYNNVVLSETEKREGGSIVYKCRCSHCGNEEWELSARRIKFDSPISCGCKNNRSLATTEHGFTKNKTKDPFYSHWCKMKSRCSEETCYIEYKEKGIRVCEYWNEFENFKNDMYESFLYHYEKYGHKNTTLDRIDTNKGYQKDNCRWATYQTQLLNRDYSKHSKCNPILAIRVEDGYEILTYNARMFSILIFNKNNHHIINICKMDLGRNIEKGWTFKYVEENEAKKLLDNNIDYINNFEDFRINIPYYAIKIEDIKVGGNKSMEEYIESQRKLYKFNGLEKYGTINEVYEFFGFTSNSSFRSALRGGKIEVLKPCQ